MAPAGSNWIKHVSADTPLSKAAVRSLKSRLAPVLKYLPLAACEADQDVEYVHKLRVWTRRAAATVRMYAELLPKKRARWLKRELKRLRKAADEARDADVLAQRLLQERENPDALRALDHDRNRRELAQQPIVHVYDELDHGRRLHEKVDELLERVRFRPKRSPRFPQEPPFREWASLTLQPFVQNFFETASEDLHDPQALHRFRITGKKLRYAMELLGSAFPPDFRDELYPMIKTLQDKLGSVNDHFVAEQRYCRWIEESPAPDERASWERLASAEQQKADRCREDFFDWWTKERAREVQSRFEAVLDCRIEGLKD